MGPRQIYSPQWSRATTQYQSSQQASCNARYLHGTHAPGWGRHSIAPSSVHLRHVHDIERLPTEVWLSHPAFKYLNPTIVCHGNAGYSSRVRPILLISCEVDPAQMLSRNFKAIDLDLINCLDLTPHEPSILHAVHLGRSSTPPTLPTKLAGFSIVDVSAALEERYPTFLCPCLCQPLDYTLPGLTSSLFPEEQTK